MGKNKFKPSEVFMKAYNRTLEKAVNSLYYESDFRCQSFYPIEYSLNCKECPFQRFSDYCNDPNFENGAGYKRTFEQWQEWFYNLTGKKDNRPKEMFMNMEKNEQTKKEIQVNEDNSEELEAKSKAKYEVEYTALDSNKPRTRYARKVVDLLFLIKQWNDEAIKWNLIANGDISKIPPDFKDIYIKVYINDCDLIFQDECTLKSKGLKLGWTRESKD